MLEVRYDLVEVLKSLKRTEQDIIKSAIEAINLRRGELLNQIERLNHFADETLKNFLNQIQEDKEMNTSQRGFIKLQARRECVRVKSILLDCSTSILLKFDNMDFSKEEELLEDQPYKDIFYEIDKLIMRSKKEVSSFEKRLKSLLEEQNMNFVFTLEDFSIRLIEKMKSLNVFSSILQKGIAKIKLVSFQKEIMGKQENSYLKCQVIYIQSNPQEQEMFAIVTNCNCSMDGLGDEQKNILITACKDYLSFQFFYDLCDMLMLVMEHLDATVKADSENNHNWIVYLKVKE